MQGQRCPGQRRQLCSPSHTAHAQGKISWRTPGQLPLVLWSKSDSLQGLLGKKGSCRVLQYLVYISSAVEAYYVNILDAGYVVRRIAFSVLISASHIWHDGMHALDDNQVEGGSLANALAMFTLAVLRTAPRPVETPQPSRQALSNGALLSILATLTSWTTVYSEKVDVPICNITHMCQALNLGNCNMLRCGEL